MEEILGIVGGIIAACAALYYVYDILWGNTRPSRVTWGVWALIALLGLAGTIAGGAGPGAYVIAVYFFLTITIFLISLFPKYGKPDHQWYDWPIGVVAILGLLAWHFGNIPSHFAVVIAIVADSIAFWPTLRGAWLLPKSEPLFVWWADVVASIFGIAAVTDVNFTSLAFPLYLVIAQTMIVFVLIFRRSRNQLSKSFVQ